MTSPDFPITPAVRLLRERGIPFEPHLYEYEEHGGAAHAAFALGVPLHAVVKTLVMETDDRNALLVLMHGDFEVSTKQLARALTVKRVIPCDVHTAQRQTGYIVGGISPLGSRNPLPVYAESSVLKLPRIYLNGGKRGFLVSLSPADLLKALVITSVNVAIPTA
jgi:Cys-tRNA(Pro) deacylase